MAHRNDRDRNGGGSDSGNDGRHDGGNDVSMLQKSSASSMVIDPVAQDVTLAWPWLTTKAINGECHVLAWSVGGHVFPAP